MTDEPLGDFDPEALRREGLVTPPGGEQQPHDGTGRVIQINPMTGNGVLFGTFVDPVDQEPIRFSGAGVTPKVPAIP